MDSRSAPAQCPSCSHGSILERPGYQMGEFRLYSCLNCLCHFVYPMPGEDELLRFYSGLYGERMLRKTQERKPLHADGPMIVRWIRRFAPNAKDACEVGCGSGRLLLTLKEAGFRTKGYEPAPILAETAARTFRLDVVPGTLQQAGSSQFDVVIERHVIEHVLSPTIEMSHIARVLKPGGIAILATPNFASVSARCTGLGWEWFNPPAHAFYLDAASMKHLFRNVDLDLVHTSTRQGDCINLYLAFCAALLLRIQRSKLHPRYWEKSVDSGSPNWMLMARRFLIPVTQGLFRATLPLAFPIYMLGLGEELWMVARKRAHPGHTQTDRGSP